MQRREKLIQRCRIISSSQAAGSCSFRFCESVVTGPVSAIAHNNNIVDVERHADFLAELKECLAPGIDRVGFLGALA